MDRRNASLGSKPGCNVMKNEFFGTAAASGMYSNSVHRVPIRSKILLLERKRVSSKTRDVSDTIPKALLRGTSRPPLVVKTEVQIEYAHSIPV